MNFDTAMAKEKPRIVLNNLEPCTVDGADPRNRERIEEGPALYKVAIVMHINKQGN